MREILFRGKRIDNGEWCEGYYVYMKRNESHRIYTGDRHIYTDKDSGSWTITLTFYNVIPETVGQYTGSPDKNGKKIFEGDILKIYEGSENDGYKICEVYSYGGVLCVDYETSEWDFNALAFLDSDNVFTFEVIGNVHDNPELLGGDDK